MNIGPTREDQSPSKSEVQDAYEEVLFATKTHELPFSHKDFKWLPESSISFIAPKTEICKVPCHVLLHNSPIR